MRNRKRKFFLILVGVVAFNISISADSLQFNLDSLQKTYLMPHSDSTEVVLDSTKANFSKQSDWTYPLAAIAAVTTAVFLLFSLRSK